MGGLKSKIWIWFSIEQKVETDAKLKFLTAAFTGCKSLFTDKTGSLLVGSQLA